jgi:hypothetical protein
VKQPAGVLGPKCLIIFLRKRLTLAEAYDWPIPQLSVANEVYKPVSSDWSGFYDWMRDNDGRLLGLRYWPFPETEFLEEMTKTFSYARVRPKWGIEIFFFETRSEPNPELSCDQDFIYDQVFCSASGQYAIAFATDELNDQDFRTIAAADADWVPV